MPRQARLFPSATIARFDTHCLRSLLADQYKCSRSNFRIPHREAIKRRLGGSPLIGPEKRKKKAIRTADCLSDSEFPPFRFFLSIAGIGQSSGSPSFGYFSWRSKKSDCLAA
jgi:hypothetical protein